MDFPIAIDVGYEGERNARKYVFDISEFLQEYPTCSPVILARRPGEPAYYVVARYTLIGNSLTWIFSPYDAQKPGQGDVHIRMIDANNDVLVKSPLITTRVAEHSRGTEEIPEWYESVEDNIAKQVSKVDGIVSSVSELAEQARGHMEASQACAAEAKDSSDNAAVSCDNAEAYSNASVNAASDALRSAGRAELFATIAEASAATHGVFDVYIDEEGYLHYVRTDNIGDINLYLNEKGELVLNYGLGR